MTRLWQRNLVGAAVSVVVLAVITATSLWPDWSDYRRSTHPEHVVAAGAAGEVAGTTWQVDSVRYLNSSSNRWQPDLPDGTLIHVVTVEHSGAALAGCSGMITDGRQRWSAEPSGGSYGPIPPEGTTSGFCGASDSVQFSFLLPGDVVPVAVDIMDWTGRILVRLML